MKSTIIPKPKPVRGPGYLMRSFPKLNTPTKGPGLKDSKGNLTEYGKMKAASKSQYIKRK